MADPYAVHVSGAVGEELRTAVRAAASDGRVRDAMDAALALHRATTWVPSDFGESRGRTDTMGEHRIGFVLPLAVEYAVQDDRRVVVVRTFRFVRRRPRPV